MSGISDEMLMAYVDDELSAEDRTQVDSYLRSSPDAAARLEVFAQTSRALGGLFDDVLAAPVPRRLIDAVRAEQASGVVVDFAERKRRRGGSDASAGRMMTPGSRGYALAASVAAITIIAGAALFATLSGKNTDDDLFAVAAGERAAPRALAAVLERGLSGTAAEIAVAQGQVSVKPVFSFATVQSDYCRQYVIDGRALGALEGVACRGSDGEWRIKAQVALSGPVAPQGGDKIVPAGRAGAPEIEALVDALISGDVLGAQDEKTLIDGDWVKPQR